MVRRNGLCGPRKDGFGRVFYAKSGLEGPSHRTNRILRGLPNIPRLTWRYLMKLVGAQFGAQLESRVLNSIVLSVSAGVGKTGSDLD